MMRSDRDWTHAIAACALDRAQPILEQLDQHLFGRVNLSNALASSGIVLERETPFATVLWPALSRQLGSNAQSVLAWLGSMPLCEKSDAPATSFWRGMFRELRGTRAPELGGAANMLWTQFVQAFRGRAPDGSAPAWLHAVSTEAQFVRQLADLAERLADQPFTNHDRGLYARFGWNDDGQVPGLTELLDAIALLKTRGSWQRAAPHFSPEQQHVITAAAQHVLDQEREAGAESVTQEDAQRYRVPHYEMVADLFPPVTAPPLDAILREAQ
jgi:hypothetical protein